MMSVQECRDSAAKCAHLAREEESRKQRDTLFAISRTWETLAKQTARFEALREND